MHHSFPSVEEWGDGAGNEKFFWRGSDKFDFRGGLCDGEGVFLLGVVRTFITFHANLMGAIVRTEPFYIYE